MILLLAFRNFGYFCITVEKTPFSRRFEKQIFLKEREKESLKAEKSRDQNHFKLKNMNGAEGGTRTPTPAIGTRSLVLRVYQFHHSCTGRKTQIKKNRKLHDTEPEPPEPGYSAGFCSAGACSAGLFSAGACSSAGFFSSTTVGAACSAGADC